MPTVTVSAWKLSVWTEFRAAPINTFFSLFRNQTTKVQSWAKYCLHLINFLITSHILLIQCQSKAILLLTYLKLNCSFKRMRKCFFGPMPGFLGILPCQAPGEYIFLTWDIFPGSDLHLWACWQLNISGHRWEGAPLFRSPLTSSHAQCCDEAYRFCRITWSVRLKNLPPREYNCLCYCSISYTCKRKCI